MRGESRRCKGSNEPLRRLPDGALATRRIVLYLLCCCGDGGASQACGSKGVPLQQSCVAAQAAVAARIIVSRLDGVTQ